MKLGQELFSVKLHELKQEYGRLQTRIRLFSTQDTEQARRELAQLQDEYQQQDLLLDERIRACRSPCAASLAAAQSDYDRRVEQILLEELPNSMRGHNRTCTQDQAEAASLYAEYAIDFAVQSTRYALIAALKAIDLQMSTEEQKEEKQHETK